MATTPPTAPGELDLDKFRLLQTRGRFYLIGCDSSKRFYRVLKIDRSEPSELSISEDPRTYLPQDIEGLLQLVSEGNKDTGRLSFVCKVYGIAGSISDLVHGTPYYLILVTKRRPIGNICGHAVYCIDDSQLITIPHSSIQSDVAKVEKSRKQMKERKNRAKKVRGVKKTKAGHAAKAGKKK